VGDGTKEAKIIGRNANRVFNLGEDGFALTRMMPYMTEGELPRVTRLGRGRCMEDRVLDSEGPTAHPLRAKQTLLVPLTRTNPHRGPIPQGMTSCRNPTEGSSEAAILAKKGSLKGAWGPARSSRLSVLGASRSSHASHYAGADDGVNRGCV